MRVSFCPGRWYTGILQPNGWVRWEEGRALPGEGEVVIEYRQGYHLPGARLWLPQLEPAEWYIWQALRWRLSRLETLLELAGGLLLEEVL